MSHKYLLPLAGAAGLGDGGGAEQAAVGWWVWGTRHLLNLPEGYRTRTPGARSGWSARRMGGQGAPENLARSDDARLRRWRSGPTLVEGRARGTPRLASMNRAAGE